MALSPVSKNTAPGLFKGQRRLAAIMFTDMIGYTALGQRNESLSLELVEEQRKLVRPILKKHNGREVKTIGDAFFVEFPSALDAVRCAYDIQRATREFNISLPEQGRLHLRIGVHLGDVVESNGDISGDAVNVASRIEPLADDGGVCLTRQVYDHVQNKFELPLVSLGIKQLKNVRNPVDIFKIEMPWDQSDRGEGVAYPTNRIAVLPFASFSVDPNDSFFADGITDEIISTVAGISGLSVISRTSVTGYKGTTKKVEEIGRELKVGTILEGSFKKAGNRIRVTTQLIDVSADKHLWAQSYDRNLDDVFAVQTDIAKQVSDALRVKILAPEINRIDTRPTENTKAYTHYLRGRYHWNQRGIEDIRKAVEYFDKAVKEDSEFALGYAGLADCFEILTTNWQLDITANHQKAKASVAKALELDGDLAEAHATQGLILLDDFNFKEAEKEFRRAIELKPSYASAHQWYFQLLRGELRWDEALMHIEKAVELDPFSGVINANRASYYTSRRDFGKALELQTKTVELIPNSALGRFDLAEIYGLLRMFDEMRRECKIVVGLVQETYPHVESTTAGMIAYFEGETDALRRLIPKLEARVGQPWTAGALQIAGLYFRIGENDKGFEWLEKSFTRREFGLHEIKTHFMLDGIRDDPRYGNLLIRLGLN